ncbi:hypothetical protein ACW14X_02495 [Nocardioides sp. YJ-D4]
MSGPIEPNIHAYGTYARVEALADWLEIAALAGRRVTSAQLEDMIADNGWTRLSPRQFLLPTNQEDDATPEAWVEAVRETLLRRQEILGERWPYEFRGSWRVTSTASDPVVPYNALLALTVAHSWEIDVPSAPEVVLEHTILRALNDLGISAVGLGTASGSGNFIASGKAAATELGLKFYPSAAPMRAHAKDEGVDTVAHLGWAGDTRAAGQWLFLGQVTTARSNEWYKKIMEPRPQFWAERFQQPLHAARFLAVPHHVASDYLRYLVSPETGLVIDRLRLALSLASVSDSERKILEAVMAAGVSDGRAAA